VGIFAASSVVPSVEFDAGMEHLKRNGFEPVVAEQVLKQAFLFPGTDEERAEAIYKFAVDPTIPILWAARGGYGAGRLLPILEKLTKERGVPPQKLIIGYSDVTVLHEFARLRWKWTTLHAPMAAASNFSKLDPAEWDSIVSFAKGKKVSAPWEHATLEWITAPPKQTIRAELIGGNLSLWAALVGTPWAQKGKEKIIFLEDVDEPFYRIDRMAVQVEQAGGFDGAAAIVLGDFTNCKDESNTCLASPSSDERKPLRKTFELDEAIREIYGAIGRRTGVPIARGLPVGHGPHYAALPLGATYELTPAGKFKLVSWDGLKEMIARS
jgi:muramoyltetrapeptide carboxypeptidase